MKKTLMVNLGGVAFHIDEDAYAELSRYLESLSRHFAREEGREEILQDIEQRMAEILGRQRAENRQVITLAEVVALIAVMGRPSEISQESDPSGTRENYEKGQKRFFRNPDEKMVAGVCSGIASYFRLDPVWIRLVFIIFTLAGGSGVLIYLVLWLVIPEAQSASDRLEMRGHKVNIGNLSRESADLLRRAGKGTRSFFDTLFSVLGMVFRFVWKVLVFVAGIFLIVIGLGLLLILIAYIFGWFSGVYEDQVLTLLPFPAMARMLVGCNIPVGYLQVMLLMVAGIPFFMLFYNGLRMVFRFDRIRHLGLTVFNIWIIGIFFMAWTGMRIYRLYRTDQEKTMTIPLENPKADTLFVSLLPDDPGLQFLPVEQSVLIDDQRIVLTGGSDLYLVPKIRIEESADSLFSVTQTTLSRGRSLLEARQHLMSIRFRAVSSKNQLQISPFLRIPGERCWRGEAVNLVIRVPKDRFVTFSEDIRTLKPYWYDLMDVSGPTTFRMTGEGMEATTAEE